jgi:hypothetical protein
MLQVCKEQVAPSFIINIPILGTELNRGRPARTLASTLSYRCTMPQIQESFTNYSFYHQLLTNFITL